VKQDAVATDMLFSVAELVSAASQTVVLQPGDLVLTGSPAGNGAHWGRLLQHGDRMDSTITGLGTQSTTVLYPAATGAEGGR
jgi:2-keto-4-pentenoate hydratase/2-oxohepta-3-ene-1,7-dioic acid hydratase in catechol pathway